MDLLQVCSVSHHFGAFSTGGVVQSQLLQHLSQGDPGGTVILRVALHWDLISIYSVNTVPHVRTKAIGLIDSGIRVKYMNGCWGAGVHSQERADINFIYA